MLSMVGLILRLADLFQHVREKRGGFWFGFGMGLGMRLQYGNIQVNSFLCVYMHAVATILGA